MPVTRDLPSPEAESLLELARDLATKELATRANDFEARREFPREVFRTLGRSGLLGLAYPESYGGGEQPYETYLQVLEELSTAWLAVGLGVSVHTLSCAGLYGFGTDEQKQKWLPDMLGGELLGAYMLSEPQSGSDAAGLITKAVRDGDDYVVNGTKAWITHGGVADYYVLIARTGEHKTKGISAFLVDKDTPGLSANTPEKKMGMRGSVTAAVNFENARVSADRMLGEEGQGFSVAMSSLDGGRLGISACAVGVAQAALEYSVQYAQERKQFGQPIASFQGLGFMLADMALSVESARAMYLTAARRKDKGLPFSAQASMSKLLSTDNAMKVCTDAIQVLGGAGYVEDHPVERYFREVKVLQILEGTNQVQRMVISRGLGA